MDGSRTETGAFTETNDPENAFIHSSAHSKCVTYGKEATLECRVKIKWFYNSQLLLYYIFVCTS